MSLKNRPPSLFFLKAEARRAPLIGRVLHRGQSQAVNGFQGTAPAGAKAPLTRAAASVTEKGRLNLTLIFLAVILRNLLFTTVFFFSSFQPLCVYLFQTVPKEKFLSAMEGGLIRMSQTRGISAAACQLCCCSLRCDNVKPLARPFKREKKEEKKRHQWAVGFGDLNTHTDCKVGNV